MSSTESAGDPLIPGKTEVLRSKVTPPSRVRKTLPSESSAKPTSLAGNENEMTRSRQVASLGASGSRRKCGRFWARPRSWTASPARYATP